jgi:CRP-like cAMP-binding protein
MEKINGLDNTIKASSILKNKLISSLKAEEIILDRGSFLIKEGEVAKSIFIVKRGSMRILRRTKDDEITFRLGYQGSWMTSFSSFLTGEPSEFYIQALKKSTLLKFDKEWFYEFVNSQPQNRELWIKMLEEFVVQQMNREIDVHTYSPLERYKRLLARSPKVFQEIPHKYIASYLRMSPETLSRLKKR